MRLNGNDAEVVREQLSSETVDLAQKREAETKIERRFQKQKADRKVCLRRLA